MVVDHVLKLSLSRLVLEWHEKFPSASLPLSQGVIFPALFSACLASDPAQLCRFHGLLNLINVSVAI